MRTDADTNNSYGPYRAAGLSRDELTNEGVKAALSRVPRHEFIPKDYRDVAYEDGAVPITHGQTISQPFIVGLMTQEARIFSGAKVLEVGTGSGYQAAVLAELGAKVFSVEIIPELAAEAKERLSRLGYKGIEVRAGDGWEGWREEAPFDAILVTAAAPFPPKKLLDQLKDGGRLIVPIERGNDGEDLMVFEKRGERLVTENLGAVRFVPLTGQAREEQP